MKWIIILLIVLIPSIPVLNQLDQIEQDNQDFQTNQISESAESKNEIIPEEINSDKADSTNQAIELNNENNDWYQGESVKVQTSGSYYFPDDFLGSSTSGLSYYSSTVVGSGDNTTEEVDSINFNIEGNFDNLNSEDLINHTLIDTTDDDNTLGSNSASQDEYDIRYIERVVNATYSIPSDHIGQFDIVSYFNSSYGINIGHDVGSYQYDFEAWTYGTVTILAYDFTTGEYELLESQTVSNQDGTWSYTSAGAHPFDLISEGQHSFNIDISNNNIGNGRIFLKVSARFTVKLYGLVVGSPLTAMMYNAITNTYEFKFDIDLLRTQVSTTDQQIRSEYKYSENNQFIIHKLQIQTLSSTLNVKMYTPLEWSFANSIPSISVNWDSTNQYYEYNSLIPAVYEFQFLTNTSNIVALNDVSSDYMQCQGFECGSYQDDWFEHDSFQFDSISIDTSIVKSGSFSIRLSDTDALSDSFYLNPGLDLRGEYYVSLSYYVESWISGTLKIQYRKDAAWVSTTIDTTITNRWSTIFIFMQINDDGGTKGDEINIEFTTGRGVVFFDDFWIGQSSGYQENLGLSDYGFGATFMYWDGLKNKEAKNIQVQGSIRDRPDDTEIYSTTVTTDSLGYAYYNFKGTLEMKEYESRWFSWDSWFGTPFTKAEFYDCSNWSGYTSCTTHDDYIEVVSAASSDPEFNPSGSWDLSNVDYHYLKHKTDDTVGTFLFYWFDTSVTNKYWGTTLYTNQIVEEFYERTNPTFDAGIDDTAITEFRINYHTAIQTQQFYDYHLIQAQKTYFTPIASSYDPYYYETKQDGSKNYWDFSEGTNEEMAYTTIENGYLYYESSTPWGNSEIDLNNFGAERLDSSFPLSWNYYTHVVFRYFSNDTLTLTFRDESNVELSATAYTTENSWVYVEKEIPTSTAIRHINFYTNYAETDPSYIKLDFVYFIHKDADHNQGYNWEFEESNYLNWEAKNTPTTLTTNKGYMAIESNAVYEGGQISFEETFSTTDFYYEIRIRAESTVTNWQIEFFENTAFKGHLRFTTYTITTEWQIFILTNPTSTTDFNVITIDSYSSGTLNTEIQVEYFRLVNPNPEGLFETDEYFYFQSENDTLIYYYELDGFKDLAYDNEIIWKNSSLGSHQLTYSAIASTDPEESRYQFLQLPSTFYYYSYEIVNEFNVQVQDFSLSDYYVQSYVVASKDYTYVVKENGSTIASGSGIAEGTSIQTIRNTDLGILVNYVIEFTNATDTITFTSSYSNAEPLDLSTISLFYDIVVLDYDGYVFQNFPLLTYYNNTIISRNMIELRGNETFDKTLLTWGNDQGFNFNALNVTIVESFTSNTFVVLAYLDLIKIRFENSGLYTTSLNLTRTPGDYSLNNETILVNQGGRDYWLPTGNYSAIIFEQIPDVINSTLTDIKLQSTGFISFMRVSKGLDLNFDASSSNIDYNPNKQNSVGGFSSRVKTGSLITGSMVLLFVVLKFFDEILLWIRVNILRKSRDEPLALSDFNPASTSRRTRTSTSNRRKKI